MAISNVMANPTALQTLRSKLADYYTLTKPEVNLLILMTTSAGYYLACPGPLRIGGLGNTPVGTLLGATRTATANHWMERSLGRQVRPTPWPPHPPRRPSCRAAVVFA